MDSELKKRSLALLDGAEKAGKDLYSFVQEQAPELCDEIVNYGFWSNLLIWLLCMIIIGLTCLYTYKIYKNKESRELFESGDSMMLCIMLPMSWSISIVALLVSTFRAGKTIKALVAPRLYVLEYLKDLIG